MPDVKVPLMSRRWKPVLAVRLMLTTIAGFVHALGCVQLGQLYVSFMSSNSARLGMVLTIGDSTVGLWGGLVIAAFALGAFVGGLMAEQCDNLRFVLAVGYEIVRAGETLVLSMHELGRAATLPTVVAMGIQNAIHQVVLGADTGDSFITCSLYGVGNSRAKRGLRRQPALEVRLELRTSRGDCRPGDSHAKRGGRTCLRRPAVGIVGSVGMWMPSFLLPKAQARLHAARRAAGIVSLVILPFRAVGR